MSTLTIVPAYGRDYTSAATAIADWKARKDFRISDIGSHWNGSYVGLGDAKNLRDNGYSAVRIRFDAARRSTQVPL